MKMSRKQLLQNFVSRKRKTGVSTRNMFKNEDRSSTTVALVEAGKEPKIFRKMKNKIKKYGTGPGESRMCEVFLRVWLDASLSASGTLVSKSVTSFAITSPKIDSASMIPRQLHLPTPNGDCRKSTCSLPGNVLV